MTWSYDDALAAAKDRVRIMIGDVDETSPLLSDEAIAMYVPGGTLGQSSERLAAAECAVAIAARLATRAISISEGGSSVNWGDVAKRYRDLADQLHAADAAGDGTGLFDIAEWAVDEFSARELIRNELLRDSA